MNSSGRNSQRAVWTAGGDDGLDGSMSRASSQRARGP